MNELKVLIDLVNRLNALGFMSQGDIYAANISIEKLTEVLQPKKDDT
jgi:hypothetical protein